MCKSNFIFDRWEICPVCKKLGTKNFYFSGEKGDMNPVFKDRSIKGFKHKEIKAYSWVHNDCFKKLNK